MMRGRPLMLAVALGCGSSAPRPSSVRFVNQPPVTVVNDRLDVPQPPKPRVAMYNYEAYESSLDRVVIRGLELKQHELAGGVNALDEVPNSTWFTNRGVLTPEQVAIGPSTIDSPELHLPWTIVSSKVGGISPGFVIRDARGIEYILKLEDSAFPEMQAGADAIVDRLVWAAGYNVPEDHVVYFLPDQLLIDDKSVELDNLGNPDRHLTRAAVNDVLEKTQIHEGGRLRGTASRILEGKSLGPSPTEGVRKDDRNDRIPHQNRRDLRGLYVVYSWLDNVDTWGGNFLDMWIDDPHHPGQHYVVHYVLDFDNSLGSAASKNFDLSRGHEYRLDWTIGARALVTAGTKDKPWQTSPPTSHIRGVAPTFSARTFNPGTWRTLLPFLPFQNLDRFDGFWGAKQVGKFTRAQIRAAVEMGRYSDPRAVDYITDVLVARQRRIVAYWYDRMNPLDGFTAQNGLCFDDLAIAQGFADPQAGTHYTITASDIHGRPLGSVEVPAVPSGHVCAGLPAVAASEGGYTIYAVTTLRKNMGGTTYVHTALNALGVPTVIGIWRQ